MIHFRHAHGSPLENGASDPGSSRHREPFAAMEASLSQVHKAKRAADESLRHAQGTPEPHATTNSIFIALWEAHLSDREALFAAMRKLDEAREALQSGASDLCRMKNQLPSVDLCRTG
ncbi:hypothetical protein [Aminobacter sp. BE322]|jgi:hypothetical protein|uniref:hypothetical protein n=1 Tax=unclassified Aminobacter TaxID=2644704 RepID=UPI003D19167F